MSAIVDTQALWSDNLNSVDSRNDLDDSKSDLDTLFQSLSPPRYDTPSLPEYKYEKAAGAFDDVLKSEQGQRTLHNEVAKLGESAEDIDVSFKSVARGLDQALKTVSPGGKGAKLLRELRKTWQEHHETYIDLLWKSRRVAGRARATAIDFVDDFLPVLKDDYPIDEKKKEIARYLENLKRDQQNSRELSNGFKSLRGAVAKFQQEFEKLEAMEADLCKQVKTLEGEIAKIKGELDELCKSTLGSLGLSMIFGAASAGVCFIGVVCCPLLLGAALSACLALTNGVKTVATFSSYLEKSKLLDAKKDELTKLQSALEEAKRINSVIGNLKGEIGTMQTKLGMFEQVWICIHRDLTELEKHLELATDTEMKARFQKKIERATTIYKTVARALQLYEINTDIRGLKQGK